MGYPQLGPHFNAGELCPEGFTGEIPADILANMAELVSTLLEPAREIAGAPLVVTSCWRPQEHNAKVGGTKGSDHLVARAGDIQVSRVVQDWQEATVRLFHKIRTQLEGQFGQLILEDHRRSLQNPGKVWVHIALPSPRHPGTGGDLNAVLLSPAPKVYRTLEPEDLA